MKLTREQVVHIAELARLALTEEEIALFQEQLSAVLEYADRLQTLDTDAISPTASVLPVRNVMRTDEPCPSMDQEDVLFNAPETENGCFRVQAVLE
jgi:aspartyl-tRNA(Asn)/glutamyl-tRNA(Gln) amidotransferase subunit C